MGDPVVEAERIVRRAGRLAPRDGGRGREIRTQRVSVRWYSWRHGSFLRRGRRWFVHTRWTIFPRTSALIGVYSYKDESDGERCVDVGLWPLVAWNCGVADWPLPKDALRATSPGSGS